MNLVAVRAKLFTDDPAGKQAAQFVFRAACIGRQADKCPMAVCESLVKAAGGPSQLVCIGRGKMEYLSVVLASPDWHCPAGKF